MTTPTLTSFAAPRGDSTSLGGECRGSEPTCVGFDGTSASRLWRVAALREAV
jgi:hypothetical protein